VGQSSVRWVRTCNETCNNSGEIGASSIEMVLRVRILLAPPCSLDCRETLPFLLPKYPKDARFSQNLLPNRTAENGTTLATMAANSSFFSGQASSSPLSQMCAGESSAITYRMHGECRLDFREFFEEWFRYWPESSGRLQPTPRSSFPLPNQTAI
jgi:hypothetical protein